MNRTNFEKILGEVKSYHRTADRYYAEYFGKVSKMKATLKDEVFKQELTIKVYPDYIGRLRGERDYAKKQIHEICEDIKNDLKSWMLRPVKPETLQILHCINDFRIRLSKDELSILEPEVRDNLFAGKIFSEIAKASGYDVRFPDVAAYLKALKIAETDACIAVDAYAGPSPDFWGKDLLDKRVFNGSPAGEWEYWDRAFAADFLENHRSLDEAAGMWEQSKVDISYTLTEAEQNRIKAMVDGLDKTDEAGKAAKLAELVKIEKDLPDKLRLMGGDYQELVTKYSGAQKES